MIPGRDEARREQAVQEGLVQLDAFRGQLNALLQQHQFLTSSRSEHVRARESLEGFERLGDGGELLLPLGAEAYVRGQAVRSAAILLGVGSGLVVEMERPKAVELLQQRVGRIDQAIEELEGQMQKLDERIASLSSRLDRLTRGGAGAELPAPGDVGGD